MSATQVIPQVPRIGMVATVRNRRGVISSVRPFDGPDGRLHLVDIEFNDGEFPLEESLLWEREPGTHLLEPSALPNPISGPPMDGEDLTALIRACRWSARLPYVDPDDSGPLVRLPISSPFHGAVQVEDFQLMPLLKALRMPRVSLLIADDVGLGKTVEAGLILSELLLRRRIRRVLILTPASLRLQWRDEMWEKFSLPFEVVDREATVKLRREAGMDANPWRSHSRIIASYHYLKQADILEQFRATSETDARSGRLPWDLLIVDEAHNLTPRPFGQESDLASMLRQVAPLFEHRIFLTATPHNGHTRSFTGLLQMLDPVRFSQTDSLSDGERSRIQDVLVRRLKREINERSPTKRFCDRMPPESLALNFGQTERALSEAFSAFRTKIHQVIREEGGRRKLAGSFAVEILGKRLLSCPTAFADSWLRIQEGLREDSEASDGEVLVTRRSVDDETADDREAESRRGTAATVVGTWLKPMADTLQEEMAGIDRAVHSLGFTGQEETITDVDPKEDARFESLAKLVEERLKTDGEWRDDERLVVFTEYKTTLDYLLRRLRSLLDDENSILSLWGGMEDREREDVKRAFNDPEHPIRILVATDAASEGLNLQETARYLLHFDVPWNPSRLEQRNGRLDRHGQARDVHVWHFVSSEDHDLQFLSLVVNKVDTIREDLGGTGEVFDELTTRRLIEGETLDSVQRDLDIRVDAARSRLDVPRDDRAVLTEDDAIDPAGDLSAIAAEMDLDPEAMRHTLDVAMGIASERPRLREPDDDGRSRLVPPVPATWRDVIDDALALHNKNGGVGALPALAFDPSVFVTTTNGLPVFRPRRDTALMHLAHPVIQKALSSLTRLRFPGGSTIAPSRWTVSRGPVPEGADALLHLTVEELAVNELREVFHHWIRTLRIPVVNGALGSPLEHASALDLRNGRSAADEETAERARDLWIEVEGDASLLLTEHRSSLTEALTEQLEEDREKAFEDENTRYQSRQGEVSSLIEGTTMARLEREIEELRIERQQGRLFEEREAFDAMDRDIARKEEELARRRRTYEELREQLTRERERIIGTVIPNRYAMRGEEAQVFPVAVEFVVTESG